MGDFHTSHRIVVAREIDYTAEAELVQERAARGAPSAIRLGPIVLFSTATRDAWMIDVQDGETACLALEGEAQPIPILENESKLGIAWQARHRLDEETFTVIENDGSVRTHLGYPIAQIQRLIAEYPAEFSGVTAVDVSAARKRLRQTGRNDPCPCESGRKYKKCCLPLDEAALVGANQEVRRTEMQAESFLPEPDDADVADESRTSDLADEAELTSADDTVSDTHEPELAPEVRAAADRIWDEFDRLKQPTPAQLDDLLDQLLTLPPEATHWSEVLDVFAGKGHPDLPAVFRRIAAALPPTKAAGASYFCWNAIERFVSCGQDELVPEIASDFRRLGRESYDADALRYMVFWAMAAGRDADALAMEEHFLPIMRGDGGLMPYAVPSVCRSIFELRVGLRLRELGAPGGEVKTVARELHCDLDEEIHADYARRAAQVIRGKAPPGEFQREDFDLQGEDVREGRSSWEKALRQFEAMMHVAHGAWRFANRPPGSAFRGLWLLADAVYDERDERRRPAKSAPENLLDCLQPRGMERRIARSAQDLLGTNTPHAHLLIEAHADLLRFAARRRLIPETEAAKSEAHIAMLREKLGFVARRKDCRA